VRLCKPCLSSPINIPKPHNSASILQFWSRVSRASRGKCRDDLPVLIGLPPILESYLWKTLLNSAEIKACLAFAADHEKTDPPWLLSTSGFFFYPYLLKPEILT
ncbi:MAG TPA: hypothetical protein VLA84_09470, partial [Microcoleus sp.]|nr:hypothetical protein [Microcoleus sp.]